MLPRPAHLIGEPRRIKSCSSQDFGTSTPKSGDVCAKGIIDEVASRVMAHVQPRVLPHALARGQAVMLTWPSEVGTGVGAVVGVGSVLAAGGLGGGCGGASACASEGLKVMMVLIFRLR